MDKVSIKDRKFNFGIHTQDEIECVIVNASPVQRMYYPNAFDENKPQTPVCWSSDTQRPDENVVDRQATLCMDCEHSVRGSAPKGGRACRFSQKLAVLFENDYAVHQLHVPANSIFGRASNGHMPLQEYARFLSKNDTPCVSVYTKVYFDTDSSVPKLFFAPVRSIDSAEKNTVEEMVNHPDTIKAITLNFNAMENEDMADYTIRKVTAIHPRLDQPYAWSDSANKSTPCDFTAPKAAYNIVFEIGYDDAVPLMQGMKAAYEEKYEKQLAASPPKAPKFKHNFELVEGSIKGKDAVFQVKSNIKASFDGKTQVAPPKHWDANNKLMDEGHQLTRGSIINLVVDFIPYVTDKGNGTSLRLRGVQVLKEAPRKDFASPFEVDEEFAVEEEASPFAEEATAEPANDDGFEDEPEEPKKVAKKEKSSPKVKDEDDDLDAIINEWGDDD